MGIRPQRLLTDGQGFAGDVDRRFAECAHAHLESLWQLKDSPYPAAKATFSCKKAKIEGFLQSRSDAIPARLFGNTQERRRFLKGLAVRAPGEPLLWFLYHYVLRLGFLEGRPGLIASRLRSDYIAQVRAKLYELCLRDRPGLIETTLKQ